MLCHRKVVTKDSNKILLYKLQNNILNILVLLIKLKTDEIQWKQHALFSKKKIIMTHMKDITTVQFFKKH